MLRSIGTVVGFATTAGSISTTRARTNSVESPTLVDRSFTVEGVAPGNDSRASANISEDEIELTGTITGSSSCQTAQLAGCCIIDEEFVAAIETVEPDDEEVCLPHLTEITYRARFQFEPASPQRVTVIHDDRVVLGPDSSNNT